MTIIGNWRLDQTFLDIALLNGLFAYSAYFALMGGGFMVLFVAFIGAGAYAASAVVVHASGTMAEGLAAAALFCGVAGAVFAFPLRRLSGIYLGIASFAVVELCQTIEVNWQSMTNGELGLTLPISDAVGTGVLVASGAIVLLSTAIVSRSNLGAIIKLRRVDPLLASTLGVNGQLVWYSLIVVSSTLAGFAGGLQASWYGFVSPDTFSFTLTVTVIAAVFLGGNTHWLGPALGAVFFTALPEALQTQGQWYQVVTGASLLLIMLLAPTGVAGNTRRALIRYRANRHSARHPEEVSAGTASRGAPTDVRPRSVDDAVPLALEGRSVSWSVAGLSILEDVTIGVAPGEICGLVGPNGSGKTSLLNILSGVTRAWTGEVRLHGSDVSRRAAHAIARLGLVRTFQGVRLSEDDTVLTNVRSGAWREAPDRHLVGAFLWSPRRVRAARGVTAAALEALRRAGAGEFARWLAADVSYGTRRKIELARALVARPSVLLLDEPTAGVSTDHVGLMKQLILDEASRGCAVLIVDHDLDVIKEICDRVVVLDAGVKIYDGPPDGAFDDARVQEAYIGA